MGRNNEPIFVRGIVTAVYADMPAMAALVARGTASALFPCVWFVCFRVFFPSTLIAPQYNRCDLHLQEQHVFCQLACMPDFLPPPPVVAPQPPPVRVRVRAVRRRAVQIGNNDNLAAPQPVQRRNQRLPSPPTSEATSEATSSDEAENVAPDPINEELPFLPMKLLSMPHLTVYGAAVLAARTKKQAEQIRSACGSGFTQFVSGFISISNMSSLYVWSIQFPGLHCKRHQCFAH